MMSVEADHNAKTATSAAAAAVATSQPTWSRYGDTPYWLGVRIASGGMGTVHLGLKHGALGFRRLLAIKRLHGHLAQDPEFVARFNDEIHLVSRLNHPNIVQTFDVLETNDELALVMEFVDGITLHQLQKDACDAGRQVPIQVVVGIVAQLLHGLHSAHELNDGDGRPLQLVHRDVSPQNIMIARDGLVKVLDFGVAKAASETHVTRTGQLSGKAAYMSPEQATGHTVDRRTDLFAAGVVLWEALTGHRLFRPPGTPESAAIRNVLEQHVVPPSELRPEVSPILEKIVLRALERDPKRRYGSARDFALALEDAVPQASLSAVASGLMQISGARLAAQHAFLPQDGGSVDGGRSPMASQQPVQYPLVVSQHVPPALGQDVTRPIGGVAVERAFQSGVSPRTTLLFVLGGVACLGVLALVGRSVLWPSEGSAPVAAAVAEDAMMEGNVMEDRVRRELVETAVEAPRPPPPTLARGVVTAGEATAITAASEASVNEPPQTDKEAKPPAAVVTKKPRSKVKRATSPEPDAPTKPKPNNCSPPTYTDAEGIRHFKPECL